MKTVAIISEYNPFHSGHLHQIEQIRAEFGEDTRIVAVMSGNYTQRAKLSFLDKAERARMAVLCGVNLVLELPFPYSLASAEIFAEAGVRIADALGCVDYLSFGSECGDMDLLQDAAEILDSPAFVAAQKKNAKENPDIGHAALAQLELAKHFGEETAKALLSPNNILAIEYLKALKRIGSTITPHTVKRFGQDYRKSSLENAPHQSAGSIRAALREKNNEALSFIPDAARGVLSDAIANNTAPTDEAKLSSAVLSFFRLSNPAASCKIADAQGGLYNRLITKSYEATDIYSLAALSQTKRFTNARIRRAIWFSFFGVTSSDIKKPVAFTRVLALDTIGRAVLREAKKAERITIVTKPSEAPDAPIVKKQKGLSDKADAVFQLAKPEPTVGNLAMLTSPYFKG